MKCSVTCGQTNISVSRGLSLIDLALTDISHEGPVSRAQIIDNQPRIIRPICEVDLDIRSLQ
jgi:hypothetical protein